MRVLFVTLTIAALSLTWGLRPASAAGTASYANTRLVVPGLTGTSAAAGIHPATATCTDPKALCLPGDKLIHIFDDTKGICTWTNTTNWGDGTSVTHVISPGNIVQDEHTYAPGEYTFETSGTGLSTDPNVTCIPFDNKLLVQAPVLAGPSGPTGGPITGAELLGGGSPSEPDLGCGCAVSGDPVNDFSGNLAESPAGLGIPGRGLALDVTETYNSLVAGTDSPLGFGWTMSYLFHLAIDPSGNVTLNEEGNSEIHFTLSAGVYSAPPRVVATLTKNPDGSYTLVRQNRLTYTFTSTGQLTAERDRNGYVTTLSYANGYLSRITDSSGRSIAVGWSGSHIVSLTDPIGRSLQLGYDPAGDLTTVTAVPGPAAVWRYGYDAGHNLISITDPRGIVTQNIYDSTHRVIEQIVDPSVGGHSGLNRATSFTYTANPNGSQTTTVVDPKGNQTVDTFTFGELTSYTRGAGTACGSHLVLPVRSRQHRQDAHHRSEWRQVVGDLR